MLPDDWQDLKSKLNHALELDPEARAAYLAEIAVQDAESRREVESLLAAHEQANTNFLRSPLADSAAPGVAPVADFIGRRIGPYQITAQIGAGGMGEVYRAFRADDQYKKEVAIKVVRAGRGSGTILNRFKNERQILASLEHPNIARLLDGGTTEEGLPYFVMELIDGEPIDHYCEQQALTIPKRLELFLQVCSAVDYAHRHLIIHRDIKPGNILVTWEGVPKLLDFGIAKILKATEAETPATTITVFQVLTPSYASPEQIKGSSISTASDVYSLGVVLYELLTGRSPYGTTSLTPDEISRAVREMEPARPSERCAEPAPSAASREVHTGVSREKIERARKYLRGDLDNIILMALRKEPERRYSSVEQFAEDIRRHLRDLPVVARRDTLRYRTSKFITRHRAGVAAAGMMIVALLGGVIATVREARIAQHRFNDVRTLANSLIFDVHDSIRDLPGATAARKLIVDKALNYLDSLSREAHNDAGLQRELAAGYKRVGDVQGYQSSANLGDTAAALKSYGKALAIRQALFAAHPSNLEDGRALSESLQDMASTQLASGDTTAALRNIRTAVDNSERLDSAHPNDVRVLTVLRDSYSIEADILAGNFNLSNLGEISAALAARHKEVNIAERIAALQPNDPGVQRSTAVTITKMGDQLLLNGQMREAQEYYQRSLTAFEALAEKTPNQRVLDNLHGMYTRMQQLEMWSGNAQQAVSTNRKALQLSLKLKATDPNDDNEKQVVAGDYGNLADSLSRAGVRQESISSIEKAMALIAEVVEHNPKNMENLGMQQAEYVTAGDVFRRFGDYRRAERYYRESTAIGSKIQAADPNNADVRLRLAATDTELGLSLVRLQDFKGATEAYNEALKISEPAANSGNSGEDALYTTANAYAGMGEIEAGLASRTQNPDQERVRWRQAASWYERSLKMWARVKEPGVVSPEGFEPVPLPVVNGRFAECQGRIARLREHGHSE